LIVLDFSSAEVAQVEEALERLRPGRWRRLLKVSPSHEASVHPTAAWRVDLPENATRFPDVHHFLVFADRAFPFSNIRIAAPGMEWPKWPHVEYGDLLCLPPTSPSSPVSARVEAALTGAIELLNWSDEKARQEFGREFRTYWGWHVPENAPLIYSLADPSGPTRRAYSCSYEGGVLVGDKVEDLIAWIKNAVGATTDIRLGSAAIILLEQPLLPSEFPRAGKNVLELAGENADILLKSSLPLPVLLSSQTEDGRGFVGLMVLPVKDDSQRSRRGSISHSRAIALFNKTVTPPCRVERVDRSWVHGRDHGEEAVALKNKRVGLVGCGALGSQIAMALARAGIGRFVLVDKDSLHAHNISRHLLGAHYIGRKKAAALAEYMRAQLPSIVEVLPYSSAFEDLGTDRLAHLSECDVLITAGLERRGERAIDLWRAERSPPIPIVCSWVEEFALAGHAAALLGNDRLESGYGADGNFRFLATSWPNGAPLIHEVGCANDFQPFGAVDLLPTVQMTTHLCLEIIAGRREASCRKSWLGSRARARELGGVPTEYFSDDECQNTYPWRS
jgi:hypothetical protein